MQTALTILAVLAVVGCQGFGFNPLFQQYPGQAGHQSYGYGYGQPHRQQVKPVKRLQLTCVSPKDEYNRNILAATIREKREGYGGGQSSLFNFPFAQSFQHGFGQHGSKRGLEAVFELYTDNFKGGKVAIIVTEKGYIGDGCYAKNFGKGLSPEGYGSQSSFGYGSGLVGGSGFNHGFADPSQFFSGKGGYGQDQYYPDGVLAEVNIKYGVPKVVNKDKLDFDNLKHLAGRGLIACTSTEADYENKAKCVGKILACCSLAYDHEDRKSIHQDEYYVN